MPAAVQETSPKSFEFPEPLWKALKAHILRERARKKQEREQEVEEERLRKEREDREQQDVMTLGETKEQLTQLEVRMTQLKEEKHQLFLLLKKVLNEDDKIRKEKEKSEKGEIKECKENRESKENREIRESVLPNQNANLLSQQIYIQTQHQQPSLQQQAPQPPRLAPMPQQQPQAPPQTAFKQTKRPRSPSPPSQVPVSLYHGYAYKPAPVATASYQGSPQKDDSRRSELVRAVLWNKTPQYSNQPSAFYPVAPQDLPPMYYPINREPTRSVYETSRIQSYHLENKLPEHYTLRNPGTHSHSIHPGTMPLAQQAPQKGGSIAAGYPVRSQPQYQQTPTPTTLYTGQTRPLYQSPVNYPPRE